MDSIKSTYYLLKQKKLNLSLLFAISSPLFAILIKNFIMLFLHIKEIDVVDNI